MITGGRNYVSSPPAFSNDSKKLLVCTGNTVSIFSTSTGLQVTELEGHTALVTSVIVVPASTAASKILCFCWTASLDGTIRYWDFSIPELMKTINIHLPIYSMVIPGLLSGSNENTGDLFAYLCIQETKAQKCIQETKGQKCIQVKKAQKQQTKLCAQIRKCNLSQSRLVGGMTLAEIEKPKTISISSSGKYIAFTDKRKLLIWQVPAKETERAVYKKMRLHHTKNFSTIAFHPTQRIVAAGDVTGRILIWRGFGNTNLSTSGELTNGDVMKTENDRPGLRDGDDADSCTTWHWHSYEVKVLFFSSDGAYLYSGGKEGVLVVWQLDSGKKKFLPRIGSPLQYFMFSPDPTMSSISCADNRIHVLKMPSMEILKTISGIKLPRSVPDCIGLSTGLTFDSAAGVVAISTANYCIQFFSLLEEREISEVQVCERNHQPGDEIMVIVNLVALSNDGSLMGTVETRLSEEGIGGLISLKFWDCNSPRKDVSLSTVVYEPHRDAGVSCITFHPKSRMAVSCALGGDFKIWVSKHENWHNDQALQRTGWTCHAVGSYKKKPMTAAAFSSDGSVLAVAADTFITLWDPDKNVLVAVIGESLEPIISLSFVGKSEYLVSASQGSKAQLSVWSMSKLSACFSYNLHIQAVACTTDDDTFAVLALLPKSNKGQESTGNTLESIDGVILLFRSEKPVPVATWFVSKAEGGGLAYIDDTTQSRGDSKLEKKGGPKMLAYINGQHEYVLFYPRGEKTSKRRKIIGFREETEHSGYASLYGELPDFNLKRDQEEIVPISAVPSERPWETIFSGSSHNLPPLTKLCSVFLESLLERRIAVVE